jgi:hypothetical protein
MRLLYNNVAELRQKRGPKIDRGKLTGNLPGFLPKVDGNSGASPERPFFETVR